MFGQPYTLTINATNGTVTKTPDKSSYNSGESVIIRAFPNSGYGFGHWYGDFFGLTNPDTVVMDGNKTVNLYVNEVKVITLPNGKQMRFRRIPSGVYWMGNVKGDPKWVVSSDGRPNAERVRRITIAYEFYIQETEHQQGHYVGVMDSLYYQPSMGSHLQYKDTISMNYTPWKHVKEEFLPKINSLSLGTFRLPTEAEWEYAVRGPETNPFRYSDFYFGEATTFPNSLTSCEIDAYVWWGANYSGGGGYPMPCGKLIQNPYGLYDMPGNIYEWCEDDFVLCYDGAPTDGSAYKDSPPSPPQEDQKVLRGAWHESLYPVARFRSAFRTSHGELFCHGSTGFRLVLEMPADAQAPTNPSSLQGNVVSCAQIDLSWTASTDNAGISGYKIIRNDTCVDISHTNTYSDKGLSPNTSYTYTVQAFDARGNVSGFSNSITKTTGSLSTNPPVANSQIISVEQNSEVEFTLQASQENGHSLSYHIVNYPPNGMLFGYGKFPQALYMPDENYSGVDSFTFRVYDGYAYSNTSTVKIEVSHINQPPSAASGSYVTKKNTPVFIMLHSTDQDTNGVRYNIVTQPSHGNLTGPMPYFTYTPSANYVGNDEFTFNVSDGEYTSDNVNVTITVQEQIPDTIVHINFDDNVNDISGNGLSTGIFIGHAGGVVPYTGPVDSLYVPGKYGKGFWCGYKTDSCAFVKIANHNYLNSLGKMFTSMWARKRVANSYGYFWLKFQQYKFSFGATSISGYLETSYGSSDFNYNSNAIKDTNWHKYDVVYDGKLISLFMDGTRVLVVAQNGALKNNAYDLFLGKDPWGIGANIEIDEFILGSFVPDQDAEAPSIPENLRVTNISSEEVKLEWDASTDNINVYGYQIYRNDSVITVSQLPKFTDVTVSPNTSYTYSVAAFDASGNASVGSASQNVFTGPSMVDNQNNAIGEFMVYQNFPNPFNPATKIAYNLPSKMHVILKVYNILGQEVKVLVDEEQLAGSHEVVFDANKFASGIYFYKMSAGSNISIKKMLLLK
jgi:formylglycine-generating enzyme required for sulfatase activity/chitodextrinase